MLCPLLIAPPPKLLKFSHSVSPLSGFLLIVDRAFDIDSGFIWYSTLNVNSTGFCAINARFFKFMKRMKQ